MSDVYFHDTADVVCLDTSDIEWLKEIITGAFDQGVIRYPKRRPSHAWDDDREIRELTQMLIPILWR